VGFVERFTSTFGAPTWVTLMLLVAFYGVAAFRRIFGAERWALTCLLVLAVVGRDALSWEEIAAGPFLGPNPALLGVLAAVLFVLAVLRRQSWWWLECSIYAVQAARTGGWFDGWIFSADAIALHAHAAAAMVIASVFRDRMALVLRELSAGFLCCAPAAVCLRAAGGVDPAWVPVPYIAGSAVVAGCLGSWLPHRRSLYAAVVNIALVYSTSFLQLYGYLDQTVRWAGLRTFAIGIGLLHVGLLISAAKGGALRSARLWLTVFADRRR